MPLCASHGQVYGEGGACIVCAGGTPRHEAESIVPQVLTTDQRNEFDKALHELKDRVAALEDRISLINS